MLLPPSRRKLGVVYCYNRPAYIYYVPCTREGEGGPLRFGEAVHITRYGGEEEGGRGVED